VILENDPLYAMGCFMPQEAAQKVHNNLAFGLNGLTQPGWKDKPPMPVIGKDQTRVFRLSNRDSDLWVNRYKRNSRRGMMLFVVTGMLSVLLGIFGL